jgi:hypothetical protein
MRYEGLRTADGNRETSDAERRTARPSDRRHARCRGRRGRLAAVDDGRWAELHRLWLNHLVLFFPGRHLTPDEHVALGRRSDLTGPVRS